MTVNTTLIKIGNSTGVIIPAKILKSLSLSGKDKVNISEENGRITICASTVNDKQTPFSALDAWYDENGYDDSENIDASLDYVASLRAGRNNKDIPRW